MLQFAATPDWSIGSHQSGEPDVGRSIVVVALALGSALSSTLVAQVSPAQSNARPHAIGFGFVATLGDNWQMEAAEIGYVRRPSHGFAALGISGRLGTFMNESTMLGGSQGVVFAGTLSARTHMKSIAQLGAEEHGTGIGFDLTFELSGYVAASSPMSLGSRWAGVSVLPAFSIGSGSAPHFAIVVGPTAFFTTGKPVMRGLLAFRGEAPLARKERHP
jgi:hypothetical protein